MRDKVKKLIALAVDNRTPDKERFAAALKACQLIQDHDLLTSPIDAIMGGVNNETVAAGIDIFTRLADPAFVKSIKKVAGGISRARSRRRS